ncbi:hypothetical protein BOTBODRAFT_169706 [Botryobasidium botryosum FD-172 SS1]|uniref:Uncharacterized protein n=1 Tax=Botryobasidium botryosum (strain FD-172 SS1) TaxID=930990 RepID=A0A067MZ60_BOTB1|nr:hypothetical protein BOTBODRAFT_169706 [Botryobasidium botryosum FD-172 SS1]
MAIGRDKSVYGILSRLAYTQSTSLNVLRWRNDVLSNPSVWTSLDRIQVLGEEDGLYGHGGCVNALSWAPDGQTLISSGDDTRVCIWRLSNDPDDMLQCETMIETGHTNNVFNAHYLPSSQRIATCAADGQVRVFDLGRGAGTTMTGSGRSWSYLSENASCIRVLQCHRRRYAVKRIVTEASPDHFLTVSEDRTVRQHDLRTRHTCPSCSPSLLLMPHELSTISVSSLTPYYFTVAGNSPYGHLFDRRMIPRILKAEWGVNVDTEELVCCVRRFGRREKPGYERVGAAHVTGSRMADSNGHELLLSYSGDGVYIFSIFDDPEAPERPTSILKNNKASKKAQDRSSSPDSMPGLEEDSDDESDDEAPGPDPLDDDMPPPLEDVTDSSEEASDDEEPEDPRWSLPVVFPLKRFRGHINIETVKDVNFMGPRDDYVVSGSDDGNWFMWSKHSGELQGIWEGDGSIVNVIETHPYLPIVAVSGIDSTVKIFGPTIPPRDKENTFSKMHKSSEITQTNDEARVERQRRITYVLDRSDCTFQ